MCGKMENKEKSFMVVNFEGNGSALFSVDFNNVTPTQILAVASWLEWTAKSHLQIERMKMYDEQINKDGKNKILVPGIELP